MIRSALAVVALGAAVIAAAPTAASARGDGGWKRNDPTIHARR